MAFFLGKARTERGVGLAAGLGDTGEPVSAGLPQVGQNRLEFSWVMPSNAVGLSGSRETKPVDGAAPGSETDEVGLLSEEGAEATSQQDADGLETGVSEDSDGAELSQPSGDGADDQGSGPGDDAQDGDGKPRKRDRVQERIDELTSRWKSADERAGRAEERLRELEAKLQGDTGADGRGQEFDPIAADPKVSEFNGTLTKARSEADAARTMRRRLKADPDQVIELLRKKGIDVADADAAFDWLEDYEARQRDVASEARERLGQRKAEVQASNEHASRAWDAAAETRYDWMKDPADKRHELMANARKMHPWILKFPAGRAALAALADMAFHADQKRQEGAKPTRAPGIRPAGAGNGSPASRPGTSQSTPQARRGELEKRLDQNPDDDAALTELLGSGLG